MFQIAVTFCLEEGEEDTTKSRINGFRRKHGDKGTKSMKMEGSEDMHRKFSQVHAKRNVRILKGPFQRVKMALSSSDPMGEADEFM